MKAPTRENNAAAWVDTRTAETLAGIMAELDAIASARETEKARFSDLQKTAGREAEKAEQDARRGILENDAADTFADLTAAAIAHRARAEAAAGELDRLNAAPLIDRTTYERIRTQIFGAVEADRAAFLDFLAQEAERLAQEAERLAQHTEQANAVLRRLQSDIYKDADRVKDKNGRAFMPGDALRVDNSGLISAARKLSLSPLLSGRVAFKDRAELATWKGGAARD